MMQLLQIGGSRRSAVRDERNADGARAQRWQHLRPSSAQVYIENRCHLKCAHCYETDETHPFDDRMTLSEYERIFDQLAQLGVLFLTFTGGELFLRRDACDLIEAARKRRFAVTLFTSGTLIDEAKADRLKALQVQRVHISIYSHRAPVHDAFTGVAGSHERSVRALRFLRQRGVSTVLKATLMTINVDHIDGLIELARTHGADWTFDPTVKPRMNGDTKPTELALSREQVRRLVLSRPDLYSAFRKHQPDAVCRGEAPVVGEDGPLCGAAREVLSIGADGRVYACGLFPVAAGDLRQKTLQEIWFSSSQLDDVRRTSLRTMNGCTTCRVRSTCSPCMAYAAVEHGDHRGCASSSRKLAEAVRSLADHRVRAEQKMANGRPLRIVGDLHAPPPVGASTREPLATE